VGSAPYKIIKPILAKVDNAYQLRRIEMNSPHLEEDTIELWKKLIARDFPVHSERLKFEPSNPRSWHKIYNKYRHIDAEEKRLAEERLSNAFKSIKQEKVDNSSQVVNYDSRKLPRLPRDVKPQAGIRPRGPRNGPDLSELRFSGGSRTKTNTPKSLLTRAKREAREISAKLRLNTISTAGQVRQGRVLQAPQGMVQEKVNESRSSVAIRAPTSRPRMGAHSNDVADREARLRKAKEPALRKGGSYIADEDLDDLDLDEDDSPGGLDVADLEALDDEPQPAPTRKAPPPVASSSAPRRSAFARKMGNFSTAPTTSRVQVETVTTQPAPKGRQPEKKRTESSASPPAEQPPKPVPSSSSASPAPGAPIPRKRKPVDIFMRPKKIQRVSKT
jgi:elongin-A